ncbi:DNA-directed RNA polymerase subunit omega [Sporomusa acidovorans]|uniref:DNA-directed RNA polymerase subunit omega n=1 Tax=Sporomusa acidovorans (strain ATCC 49682 / DSM 3132 / Mol) TaxID=1123286 RepID=A0ABZ3J4B5_SPOA4|nr:DNA-directed RNA polymerase subunit omega [Sporomusa acidovorans]OZC20272.1 DNA-directed RNA polymerase subunit omega [Sporomusa acidovorans DSM 3132]SDD39738.1 DNA-directed RNA polymerase subunit omega [Sporomusa acidovorans]
MNHPILEDLLQKVDCKYTLAVLAAKRAREIIEGSEILVETKSAKPVSIALEEIVQGKIKYQRTKDGIK